MSTKPKTQHETNHYRPRHRARTLASKRMRRTLRNKTIDLDHLPRPGAHPATHRPLRRSHTTMGRRRSATVAQRKARLARPQSPLKRRKRPPPRAGVRVCFIVCACSSTHGMTKKADVVNPDYSARWNNQCALPAPLLGRRCGHHNRLSPPGQRTSTSLRPMPYYQNLLSARPPQSPQWWR